MLSKFFKRNQNEDSNTDNEDSKNSNDEEDSKNSNDRGFTEFLNLFYRMQDLTSLKHFIKNEEVDFRICGLCANSTTSQTLCAHISND